MFSKRSRCVVCGDEPESVSIPTEDIAEVGVTNPRGILQHGGKHWLKIARRAAYNPKNVGGSRLLRYGLCEVVGVLAKPVEQPRILDGDDGLRREVLDEFDLFIAEGTDLLTKNAE